MTDTEPTLTDQSLLEATTRWPDHFRWGAATSSFQIEGATDADGRSESIWDRFCTVPGAIADGSDGRRACDHYHRADDDVALMADLGLEAYRFSVAWPRVVPAGRGEVNPAGLDFYDRLVDRLLAFDIEPHATLYHWDLPQILEDEGGWQSRATVDAFVAYAEAVTRRLGDRLSSIATLNEPFVSASHGYRTGEHAPGIRSLDAACAAAHHLLLAHGRAVPAIRALAPDTPVGIVLNFTPVFPADDSDGALAQAAVVDGWDNRWYVEPIAGEGYPFDTVHALGWTRSQVRPGDLDAIAAPIDFLGVNYYTRQLIDGDGEAVTGELPTTDMGWEVYPQGLGDLLQRLHARHGFDRYLVTENGAALPDRSDGAGFVDDSDRIDYLRRHLASVGRAVEAGVPVEGYFVWSLFDNFEWACGYEKRFGIVRVDYETLERTPKASALWYRDLINQFRAARR